MNRKDCIQALLDEQDRIIENLEEQVERYRKASDIDEDDTLDPDDLSHQTEAKDLQQRFEQLYAQAKAVRTEIEQLKTVESDAVAEGSFAVLEHLILFFGVSIPKFSVKDREVLGISSEAPIYSDAMGKTKGDTLTLGKDSYTIQEVF